MIIPLKEFFHRESEMYKLVNQKQQKVGSVQVNITWINWKMPSSVDYVRNVLKNSAVSTICQSCFKQPQMETAFRNSIFESDIKSNLKIEIVESLLRGADANGDGSWTEVVFNGQVYKNNYKNLLSIQQFN